MLELLIPEAQVIDTNKPMKYTVSDNMRLIAL